MSFSLSVSEACTDSLVRVPSSSDLCFMESFKEGNTIIGKIGTSSLITLQSARYDVSSVNIAGTCN